MTETRYTVPLRFARVRECVKLLQGGANVKTLPGYSQQEIATALSCLPFCEVVKC